MKGDASSCLAVVTIAAVVIAGGACLDMLVWDIRAFFVGRAAIRRRIREIADQAARDRTYGDWPAAPIDFEVSHRSDDGR